jgi:hypothetical protein
MTNDEKELVNRFIKAIDAPSTITAIELDILDKTSPIYNEDRRARAKFCGYEAYNIMQCLISNNIDVESVTPDETGYRIELRGKLTYEDYTYLKALANILNARVRLLGPIANSFKSDDKPLCDKSDYPG